MPRFPFPPLHDAGPQSGLTAADASASARPQPAAALDMSEGQATSADGDNENERQQNGDRRPRNDLAAIAAAVDEDDRADAAEQGLSPPTRRVSASVAPVSTPRPVAEPPASEPAGPEPAGPGTAGPDPSGAAARVETAEPASSGPVASGPESGDSGGRQDFNDHVNRVADAGLESRGAAGRFGRTPEDNTFRQRLESLRDAALETGRQADLDALIGFTGWQGSRTAPSGEERGYAEYVESIADASRSGSARAGHAARQQGEVNQSAAARNAEIDRLAQRAIASQSPEDLRALMEYTGHEDGLLNSLDGPVVSNRRNLPTLSTVTASPAASAALAQGQVSAPILRAPSLPADANIQLLPLDRSFAILNRVYADRSLTDTQARRAIRDAPGLTEVERASALELQELVGGGRADRAETVSNYAVQWIAPISSAVRTEVAAGNAYSEWGQSLSPDERELLLRQTVVGTTFTVANVVGGARTGGVVGLTGQAAVGATRLGVGAGRSLVVRNLLAVRRARHNERLRSVAPEQAAPAPTPVPGLLRSNVSRATGATVRGTGDRARLVAAETREEIPEQIFETAVLGGFDPREAGTEVGISSFLEILARHNVRVRGSGPGGALSDGERSRFRLALLGRSADHVSGGRGRAAIADASPDENVSALHRERDAEAERIVESEPRVGPPHRSSARFILPDGNVLDPNDVASYRQSVARGVIVPGTPVDAPPPAAAAPSTVPDQATRDRLRRRNLSNAEVARRQAAAARRRLRRQATSFEREADTGRGAAGRVGRIGTAAGVGAAALSPTPAVVVDVADVDAGGGAAQVRSEPGRAQPTAAQSGSRAQDESRQQSAAEEPASLSQDESRQQQQENVGQQERVVQGAEASARTEAETAATETERGAETAGTQAADATTQQPAEQQETEATRPDSRPPEDGRREPEGRDPTPERGRTRGDDPPDTDGEAPSGAGDGEGDARRVRGRPELVRWRGRTRYRSNLLTGRVSAQPVDDTNLRSFEVVRRGPRSRLSLQPRRPYVAGTLQISGNAEPTALAGRTLQAQPAPGRAPTPAEREVLQQEGPALEATWIGHSEYTLNLRNRRVTARPVDDTNLRTFEVTRRGNRFLPSARVPRGSRQVGNLSISAAAEPRVVPERVAVAARPGLAGIFRRTGQRANESAGEGDEPDRAGGGPGRRVRRIATGLRETPGRFRSRIEELDVYENSLEAQARRGLSRFRSRATSLNPNRPIVVDPGAEAAVGEERGMEPTVTAGGPNGRGDGNRGSVSGIRERFRAARDPGAGAANAPSDQSLSDGSERLVPDRYRPPRSDNPADNMASGAAQTMGAAVSPFVAFGDSVFGGPQTRPESERSPAESLPGGSDFQMENNRRGLGGDAETLPGPSYRNTGYEIGPDGPPARNDARTGEQTGAGDHRQRLSSELRERYRQRRHAGAAGGSLSGDQQVSDDRTNSRVERFPRSSSRQNPAAAPAGPPAGEGGAFGMDISEGRAPAGRLPGEAEMENLGAAGNSGAEDRGPHSANVSEGGPVAESAGEREMERLGSMGDAAGGGGPTGGAFGTSISEGEPSRSLPGENELDRLSSMEGEANPQRGAFDNNITEGQPGRPIPGENELDNLTRIDGAPPPAAGASEAGAGRAGVEALDARNRIESLSRAQEMRQSRGQDPDPRIDRALSQQRQRLADLEGGADVNPPSNPFIDVPGAGERGPDIARGPAGEAFVTPPPEHSATTLLGDDDAGRRPAEAGQPAAMNDPLFSDPTIDPETRPASAPAGASLLSDPVAESADRPAAGQSAAMNDPLFSDPEGEGRAGGQPAGRPAAMNDPLFSDPTIDPESRPASAPAGASLLSDPASEGAGRPAAMNDPLATGGGLGDADAPQARRGQGLDDLDPLFSPVDESRPAAGGAAEAAAEPAAMKDPLVTGGGLGDAGDAPPRETPAFHDDADTERRRLRDTLSGLEDQQEDRVSRGLGRHQGFDAAIDQAQTRLDELGPEAVADDAGMERTRLRSTIDNLEEQQSEREERGLGRHQGFDAAIDRARSRLSELGDAEGASGQGASGQGAAGGVSDPLAGFSGFFSTPPETRDVLSEPATPPMSRREQNIQEMRQRIDILEQRQQELEDRGQGRRPSFDEALGNARRELARLEGGNEGAAPPPAAGPPPNPSDFASRGPRQRAGENAASGFGFGGFFHRGGEGAMGDTGVPAQFEHDDARSEFEAGRERHRRRLQETLSRSDLTANERAMYEREVSRLDETSFEDVVRNPDVDRDDRQGGMFSRMRRRFGPRRDRAEGAFNLSGDQTLTDQQVSPGQQAGSQSQQQQPGPDYRSQNAFGQFFGGAPPGNGAASLDGDSPQQQASVNGGGPQNQMAAAPRMSPEEETARRADIIAAGVIGNGQADDDGGPMRIMGETNPDMGGPDQYRDRQPGQQGVYAVRRQEGPAGGQISGDQRQTDERCATWDEYKEKSDGTKRGDKRVAAIYPGGKQAYYQDRYRCLWRRRFRRFRRRSGSGPAGGAVSSDQRVTETRCRPGVDLYCAEESAPARSSRSSDANRSSANRSRGAGSGRSRQRRGEPQPDLYGPQRAATGAVVGVAVPLIALGAVSAAFGGGRGNSGGSQGGGNEVPAGNGGHVGNGGGGGNGGDQWLTDARTNRGVDRSRAADDSDDLFHRVQRDVDGGERNPNAGVRSDPQDYQGRAGEALGYRPRRDDGPAGGEIAGDQSQTETRRRSRSERHPKSSGSSRRSARKGAASRGSNRSRATGARRRAAPSRRRRDEPRPDNYPPHRAVSDTVVGVTVPLVALGAATAVVGSFNRNDGPQDQLLTDERTGVDRHPVRRADPGDELRRRVDRDIQEREREHDRTGFPREPVQYPAADPQDYQGRSAGAGNYRARRDDGPAGGEIGSDQRVTETRCRPGVDLYCAEDQDNSTDRAQRRREERRQDARERREEARLERRERIAERRRRLRDDDPDYYRSGRAATDTVVGVTVPLVALGALGAFLGGGFGGGDRRSSSPEPVDAGGDGGSPPPAAPVGNGGGVPADQVMTDDRTNRRVERHPSPEAELIARVEDASASNPGNELAERSRERARTSAASDPGNELAERSRERVRTSAASDPGNELAERSRERVRTAPASDPGNELAGELHERNRDAPHVSDELLDRVRSDDTLSPDDFAGNGPEKDDRGRFLPRRDRGADGGAVGSDQKLTDDKSSRAEQQPGGG